MQELGRKLCPKETGPALSLRRRKFLRRRLDTLLKFCIGLMSDPGVVKNPAVQHFDQFLLQELQSLLAQAQEKEL